MKHKRIGIAVLAVVFLSLIILTVCLTALKTEDEPQMSDDLKFVDPTDMSQYFSMGEYYPPNSVDSLNIDWQGGRVEIVAYNGDDYFVEEAATRQLMEDERLDYSIEGTAFTVRFIEDETRFLDDVYKKVEIRIPRDIAEKLKTVNITNSGEVVLKNLKAESLTVNGKNGAVTCKNTYAGSMNISTQSGSVSLFVKNDVGYSVDFKSKSGVLDSYIDNGLNSYVSGDGTYPFTVKTKDGNLDVMLYEEE